MDNEPEWLAKLKWKAQYLSEWLDNFKQAQDVAPEVQRNLDFTKWQIEAIEETPEAGRDVPLPDIGPTVDSDTQHLEEALPKPPRYNRAYLIGASAFTSSGTAPVFGYIGRVGDIETPVTKAFSAKMTQAYQGLQTKYDLPEKARALIQDTCGPNTLRRLDVARSTYQSFLVGGATRSAVANDLRNLIEGIKGDLWERARSAPKENMNWKLMAARLAKGGPGGVQEREIINQEQVHSSLLDRLADVIKDREGGSITNIHFLWSETQDYIIALLGLVEQQSSH
jgi:hypothetical protein